MGIRFEEFIKNSGIDEADTERAKEIINDSKYRFLLGKDSNGDTVIDGNTEAIAIFVTESLAEDQQRIEEKRAAKMEEKQLQRQMQRERETLLKDPDSLLTTTGESFEGYKIVHSSGCISADSVKAVQRQLTHLSNIGVEKGKTRTAVKLVESLQSLRQEALVELKTTAAGCGCNAIIGVSYNYITLDPLANPYGATGNSQPYIFCVSATGTAVKIEKL